MLSTYLKVVLYEHFFMPNETCSAEWVIIISYPTSAGGIIIVAIGIYDQLQPRTISKNLVLFHFTKEVLVSYVC